MIDPTFDFPFNVAAYLDECRSAGIAWEDAWTLELDAAAREHGFGFQQHPFTVETALTFAKRHLRAAYERRDTPRYCVEEDCVYLALHGDYCVAHSIRGREVA